MSASLNFDAASVAIFNSETVLLIKRAREPYKDYWTLPGGRIHAGEKAEVCARREIFEELGLRISPRFVARHEVPHGNGTFSLAVFAAEFTGGAINPSTEIMAHDWVAAADFTGLKTTPELAQLVAAASQVITAA